MLRVMGLIMHNIGAVCHVHLISTVGVLYYGQEW